MASSQFATSRLPTITTQADLDSSMASSSTSRLSSSPLSSEPGTPIRGQGLQQSLAFRQHKQRVLADSPGPSNGAISDSPSSSSSWADSVPNLEHRVGPRIAELHSQHDSAQDSSSQARPPGSGVMLLSEVDLDRAGPSQPAPSSQVLLTNGRTVTIIGNVSDALHSLPFQLLQLIELCLSMWTCHQELALWSNETHVMFGLVRFCHGNAVSSHGLPARSQSKHAHDDSQCKLQNADTKQRLSLAAVITHLRRKP